MKEGANEGGGVKRGQMRVGANEREGNEGGANEEGGK